MKRNLQDEMDDLRSLIEAQSLEIDRLRVEVSGVAVQPIVQESDEHVPVEGSINESLVSRRGALLALGGVAAGGVGMAIGSTFLGIQSADGTQGSAILAGETNTATAQTEVTTTTGNALYAVTTDAFEAGISGFSSDAGIGVAGTVNGSSGISPSVAPGVWGDTNNGMGVFGSSSAGTGIYGVGNNFSNASLSAGFIAGVVGDTNSGDYGVTGLCTGGSHPTGVYGVAKGQSGITIPEVATGVFGETDRASGYGALGLSSGGDGVHGVTSADGASGVGGIDTSSGGGHGVFGTSQSGIGTYGATGGVNQVGLMAVNSANGPTLELAPSTIETLPPTSSPGQFIVLSDGSLHYCETANQWNTVVPQGLSFTPVEPKRAYDSRVAKGGPGPLSPGGTRDISLTSAGVPTGATAVLINLTVVNTAAGGYLTVYEGGGAVPSVSNINWYQSNQVTANNATPAVSSAGVVAVLCGGSGSTDFLIDVFGYYQ